MAIQAETTFILPKPLRYTSAKGKTGEETLEVILRGPSYDNRKFARSLKQKVQNGLMAVGTFTLSMGDAVKEDPNKEKEEPTGKLVIGSLRAAPESLFDWAEFVDWFWEQAPKKGVVLADDDVPFTKALVEAVNHLSERDLLEEIAGEYIASFIWPSLMKTEDG